MKKTCCSSSSENSQSNVSKSVKTEVRRRYAALATSQLDSCCSNESCSTDIGYTEEELKSIPDKAAAASAGCGNPTALAGLKEGEVVLDLGSGGGIDVLLAAQKVGEKGKAIGVDMTPEMIELARKNAEESGLKNVEFRLGEIEHLPVTDNSVDVVISNCVINLSEDKDAVFKEAYRVLKKGGRVVVSDIMAEGLPNEIKEDMISWSGCLGGAIPLTDYMSKMAGAGLVNVEVLNNTEYSKEMITNSAAAEFTMEPDLLKEIKEMKVSHAEIQAWKK